MSITYVETLLGGKAGSTVSVSPRYFIVNDGASRDAAAQVTKVADAQQVKVYFDHDVPTGTVAAAEHYQQILNFATRFGLEFLQGKGIATVHLLQNSLRKGDVVMGTGAHLSVVGAAGAMGIRLTVEELAHAIEEGKSEIVVPQTVRVQVKGTLPSDAGIIDAALTFLSNHRNLQGKAIEFYGLKPAERMPMCAMACETGAFAAVALDGQPDEAGIVLNLDEVTPMITMPVKTREDQPTACHRYVSAAGELTADAGQIGGYTVGLEGLREAARLMKGRKLALGFRLSIVPASAEDYLQAMEEGLLDIFIDYGAQINAVGDRSVLVHGAGAVDGSERLLTTGLYTFDGCMGASGAQVFTASIPTIIRASENRHL